VLSQKLVIIIVWLSLVLTGFNQSGTTAAIKGTSGQAESEIVGENLARFEDDLEVVRQMLKIPGMSAAVVQDQQLIWAKGFGYADLENQVLATADTPYGLASVTKPIAAVLIMQLVEEGVVDLDAGIEEYGVGILGQSGVTVRHLLTHTSEGIPGTKHNYNGDRYGRLGGVIEGATGKTFADLLNERLLTPLEMRDTALNPINNWGGSKLYGFEDFIRLLGWDGNFQHYAQVYENLAQPYQLDEQYNIIPGKYHLFHNPAAGLISSAIDLARFDIALDQGDLLGEAAKEQMFTPAYSTYKNRQDLAYGLGWYVQDFEGQSLLWHTGRWPPSTSALYLKVPEEELTFIVLANTDNLTVPFYGLGNGDISQSALTLAFFRHFIFPRQYGYSPPTIDWEAGELDLIQKLNQVEDESSRVFLERELWSYRQVFASVGRNDLVDRLARVNRGAFPRSKFRGDELFTATTGQFPVIPAVMRATTFVTFTRGIAVWFVLVMASLLWMVVRLARRKGGTSWDWVVWSLATLILGPMTLIVHILLDRKVADLHPPEWVDALGATLLSLSGYALGWVLAISLLISLGGEPHPSMILGASFLLPLLIGLLLVRAPLLVRQGKLSYRNAVKQGFLAEVISMNLGFAILFPLTMLCNTRVLSTIPHPTSPYFWAMMSFITFVGMLVLFPLNYWMSWRGYSIWPDGEGSRDGVPMMPTLGNAWWLLGGTMMIMVVMLAATINQMV
jgi:CubicO group peptidase (beta-lactamase class C family)